MYVVKEISNVNDLWDAANAYPQGATWEGLRYLFRGQGDEAWRLEPTLHRAAKRGRHDGQLPNAAELLSIESTLTLEFQASASNLLQPATLLNTSAPMDWWNLMQHYGAPTRLLDWTKSLFVAAYFAARENPGRAGAIYVMHASTLEHFHKLKYGDEAIFEKRKFNENLLNPETLPILLVHKRSRGQVERMVSQQGVFMACQNVGGDVENIVEDITPKPAEGQTDLLIPMAKLRIAASAKSAICKRLREINITAESLFPGLDGIGRHLDEMVRMP